MTLQKAYSAKFKALKDEQGNDTGEITAIVSVFGNVDLVGDRVIKGAFQKSLGDWKDSGDPIPMVWSHDWSDPMSHIGSWDASKARETDEGLELTGKVDLDGDNPIAKQAYRLMKERRVREFSFAYDVDKEGTAADGANELKELTLIEAGPTLKGANSETRMLAAKAFNEAIGSQGEKVGRTLSAKNESALRDALATLQGVASAIKGVLSALDAGDGKDAEHLVGQTVPEQFRKEPVNPNEPVTEPKPVDIVPVDGTPKPTTDGKPTPTAGADTYDPPADAPPVGEKALHIDDDVLAMLDEIEIDLRLSQYTEELASDNEDTDSDGAQEDAADDTSEATEES